MTHLEAVAKSNCGLAGRFDGDNRVAVVYSEKGAFMADHTGELWKEIPMETVCAYRDWEPVHEGLLDRPLDWLGDIWKRIKRWLAFPREHM